MKHLFKLISVVVAVMAMTLPTACIEDSVSTNPADQPEFSTDELDMGTIFTDQSSATYALKVYNRHSKVMMIERIGFGKDSKGYFRLNVDGRSGKEFNNIEIRPDDSIYVFVSARVDGLGTFDPQKVEDLVEFTTNGVKRSVKLCATGQDVERLHGLVIDTDTRWSGNSPRQIYDSLVVAPGATLTLEAGARLYFHDKSSLKVRGTLVSEGTAERPVVLSGDRQGDVISGVSFDVMSRQWDGVRFYTGSEANKLQYTTIENTVWGTMVDSLGTTGATPKLEMLNCRLRNSHGYALAAWHSYIRAIGCEIAEAAQGAMAVEGGRLEMNYCTLSNYYLFSAIGGPCLQLFHYDEDSRTAADMPLLEGTIANTIIYGSSADMSPTSLDGTNVYLRNCLLKSNGSDDDHFIGILWGENPLFYTDRPSYIFDYRLQPESPALGKGVSYYGMDTPTTDYYGTPRGNTPAIGAYEKKQ